MNRSFSQFGWTLCFSLLGVALSISLPTAAAGADRSEPSAFGREVARVADRYRNEQPRLRINACNGLIEDILRDAGLNMRGAVRTLNAKMKDKGWIHHRRVPLPGDVVFFDRTYDSNGNGRQDDRLSHIAVVISVDEDGTAHLVHRGSKGIRPLTMNLKHPSTRRDADGKDLNSWLGKPGYAKEGSRLAGELWASFATPRTESEVLLAAAEPPAVAMTAAVAPAKPAATVRSTSRPSARSKTRKRAPLKAPPIAQDDPGFHRAFRGRVLRAKHLDGRSCLELWYLRNALFARHGFSFRTRDARTVFAQVEGYKAKKRVTENTVEAKLSDRDRQNLASILLRERRCR
ncbi:MAG: YARHG domain-containing protein [Myxococcota bacterium]